MRKKSRNELDLENVTFKLNDVDRAELHSLLDKIDDFKSILINKHLRYINMALKNEILKGNHYTEDCLNAMEFVNQVFLCIGSHGMLAEKLVVNIQDAMDRDDEIEREPRRLKTA